MTGSYLKKDQTLRITTSTSTTTTDSTTTIATTTTGPLSSKYVYPKAIFDQIKTVLQKLATVTNPTKKNKPLLKSFIAKKQKYDIYDSYIYYPSL